MELKSWAIEIPLVRMPAYALDIPSKRINHVFPGTYPAKSHAAMKASSGIDANKSVQTKLPSSFNFWDKHRRICKDSIAGKPIINDAIAVIHTATAGQLQTMQASNRTAATIPVDAL